MISRPRHAFVALLAAAAALPLASAQSPAEGPPRYHVEVLVFAHNDFNAGEELFRVERAVEPRNELPPALRPVRPAEELLTESLEAEIGEPPLEPGTVPPPGPGVEPTVQPQGGAATPDDPSGATAAPVDELQSIIDYRTGRRSLRFRPLAPAELTLTAQRRALERLSAYRPLLHTGWVQEVLDERAAQPFDLALVGSLAPSGTVRVHLSRFLHVTLDLDYRPLDAVPPAGAGGFGLGEVAVAPVYELKTQRRIRSNEVNYFDHPAFGVLIVVRPAPAPTTPSPSPRPAA